MFSNLRGSEWLILVLLIVLLFGARRLPDAARGIGRSLRIFKAETKGLTDDSSTKTEAVGAADADQTASASTPEAPTAAPEATPEPGKPAQS